MSTPFDRYQRNGLNYSPPKNLTQESGQPIMPDVQDIPPKPSDPQGPSEFERELESLINRHSLENESGTPDFILAAYLTGALNAFNIAVKMRANWRGERIDSIFNTKYEKKLPIAVYDEHGRRNEIGEAEVEVWPGESTRHGRIVGVMPIFEQLPSTSQGFLAASEGRVEAGMKEGLASAEPMREFDKIDGEEVDNATGSESES